MNKLDKVLNPKGARSEPEYRIPEHENDVISSHIKLIQQLDVISSSSIGLFNLHKGKYEYLSSIVNLFESSSKEQAYPDPDFFYELLHPDDRDLIAGNQERFMNFLYHQPVDQRKNYKLCEDFRMKDKNGSYVRLLSQLQVLELDLSGNIWLTVDTVDLSPDTDILKHSNCLLINLETRERVNFSEKNQGNISRREKEILNLLSKGASSKEISNQLFISVNTVNNHRKNIIQKLNVSNITQAVRMGAIMGII